MVTNIVFLCLRHVLELIWNWNNSIIVCCLFGASYIWFFLCSWFQSLKLNCALCGLRNSTELWCVHSHFQSMKHSTTLWHVRFGTFVLFGVFFKDMFLLMLWLLLTGLLVVSSKDNEPISKFVDLFNTNQLPSLLNEGIMDPQILKHYLILHDQQDGPQEMYILHSVIMFTLVLA